MSTGIGDLVAHLTTDTSGWTPGLKKAQADIAAFSGGVTSSIAAVGTSLAALAFNPVVLAAAGIAATAAAMTKFVSSAMDAEKQSKKLEAVLEASGGAAGVSADELMALADGLSLVTDFEDDATVGAAAVLASFKNLRGDDLKEAIRLAQDMSTVLGIDLDAAAKKLGKSLSKVVPEDVGSKLAEIRSQFGGAAEAASSPLTRVSNLIGNIGEAIGNVLLPSINSIGEAFLDTVVPHVATLSEALSAAGDMLNSYVVAAIDAAAFAFENLDSIGQLAFVNAQLAAVQMIGTIEHFFNEQLPAWLDWLQTNWTDVFFTIGDYAMTAFMNLGNNIKEAWKAVVAFFAGTPIEPNFKKLNEGAVNAIKSLPDVPDRIANEFEQSLMQRSQELQDNLQQDFEAFRADREAERAIEKIPANVTPPASDAKGKEVKDTNVGALQKGSADAVAAINRATNGANSPANEMSKAQDTTNDLLSQMLDIQRDNRFSDGVQIVAGELG